jgi:hypothetical protein
MENRNPPDPRERTIRKGFLDDFSKVSKVSKFPNQKRLQTDAAALSAGWHPLPFMQSLQSTFHRVCSSWDSWKARPKSLGSGGI